MNDSNTATKVCSNQRMERLAISGTTDHDELSVVMKCEVVDSLGLERAWCLVVDGGDTR
jgi:hypothetical protein